MLSFALVFLWLGTMYRGMEKPKFNMLFVLNCLILMALVLSHIVPTIALVFISPGLLLVNPRWRSLGYLAAVAAIGFGLSAFWSIPFAANLQWTAHMAWDQLGVERARRLVARACGHPGHHRRALRGGQTREAAAPVALDEHHRPRGLLAPPQRPVVERSRRAVLVHVGASVGRVRHHLDDPAVHRLVPRSLRGPRPYRSALLRAGDRGRAPCGGGAHQPYGGRVDPAGTTPATRARNRGRSTSRSTTSSTPWAASSG